MFIEVHLYLGFLCSFGPTGLFMGLRSGSKTFWIPIHVYQQLSFRYHWCRDAKSNSYGWPGGWISLEYNQLSPQTKVGAGAGAGLGNESYSTTWVDMWHKSNPILYPILFKHKGLNCHSPVLILILISIKTRIDNTFSQKSIIAAA